MNIQGFLDYLRPREYSDATISSYASAAKLQAQLQDQV